MDRYLLMTSVTSQEEKAVRELYRDKNWVLYRYEIKELEITCDCGQKLDLDVLLKLETSKLRCDSEDFTTVEDWTATGNKVTLEIKEQRSCPKLDLDHIENSISDVISVNTSSDKNQPNEYGTDVREEEVTCTQQIDGFNKHFHEDTKQQGKGDQQLKSDQVSSNLGKTHSRGQKKPKRAQSKKEGVGSFHCNECNTTFKLLGSFNNHKRDGRCLFTCGYCGKKFTSRYFYNYQVHLKYHRKEKSHQCDICGKSYIEASALRIHRRKHSNEKPYVCDLCGRCFYSSSHLIYHKKSLHSEINTIHQCDLCGAVLSTLGNLKVHKQTVHVEDRPFTCDVCGKAFKTKKALEEKHSKVHENVFPFKCDFNGCEKSFKTSASLTVHIKRHNNQRSHFCERCGKGFYNKKDLRLHMRTHTGEKPYSCKLCQYSCTLAGNLRKHLKTHDH